MKIIYHCYGGAHSSVTASAIHTGLLPADRIPRKQEILTLPYFDQTQREQIGNLFYIGRDEFGSEVYILGLANHKDIAVRAITNILKIYNIPADQLIMADSLKEINILTRVGGFLSRRLGLVKIGRPLSVKGIQTGYFKYVRLVAEVKGQITRNMEKKLVPKKVNSYTSCGNLVKS